MVGVTFRGVRKAFGPVVAVENLDLDVRSGEFVSLLGPSGCGKTTCLRMLAGLEQASAGRILIGDRVVNDVPPSQRDVAMVFQSYALYPHMSVAENIAYPLRKRGVAKPEREQRVARVAEMLQLGQLLDRKPRQLSGGQQQRVALGRALVREPRVFLLDEPLSNLDAKLRAQMRSELIELHQRIAKTMIYVTHDQLEAMTMSDRIAVMGHGRLQQFATPGEIYDRPANLFVADFIGTPSMTLHDAMLREAGGGPALEFDGFTVGLPAGHVAGLDPGAELRVRAGVRPEHVQLADAGVPGVVRLVEPMGHETIAIINVAQLQVTVRLTSGPVPRAGERVHLAFQADKLHVFDRASGARLNADATATGARA